MSERKRAVLTLLALTLVGLAALGVRGAAVVPGPRAGPSDIATYQAIVAKLRAGTPYYVAVGDELRRGHYATLEVFNWRTPLHWRAISKVPDVVSGGVLIALGLVLFVATLVITAQQPPASKWTAIVMQFGVLAMLAVPEAVVMGETWAGVLVGLSVCAYCLQRRRLAPMLGLLALFMRELAAPYCIVCAVAAITRRRWSEVGTWLVGGCLYAVYYVWHLTQIQAHHLPTDFAHSHSWLELGGLPSLLTKVHWHGLLLVTPMPLTALALVLIVAGTGHSGVPRHVRLASAVYLAFFLAAGKSFDAYWGTTAWPAWSLACGYGVDAIRQSLKTAFAPPPST